MLHCNSWISYKIFKDMSCKLRGACAWYHLGIAAVVDSKTCLQKSSTKFNYCKTRQYSKSKSKWNYYYVLFIVDCKEHNLVRWSVKIFSKTWRWLNLKQISINFRFLSTLMVNIYQSLDSFTKLIKPYQILVWIS